MRTVSHNGVIMAIIIPSTFKKEGIQFFTPDDFSQQLAYMQHPMGKKIQPHVHNLIMREVHFTQEVLVVRKGKMRVDFFSNEQDYLESCVLETGDVILLASGGHGFEMLEETEMIEIKQGPFAGDRDKTRFERLVTEYKII